MSMYILNTNGDPEPCDDVLAWGQWFETADRIIAQDQDERAGAEPVCVSTIFLGLDHNYLCDGPPVLWETMVFGGPLGGLQRRYTSREDALTGHQAICRQLKEEGARP